MVFSSYSIKALHYIGNVETLDRYQLGAPKEQLRCSSGVEQRLDKPLAASSNLATGTMEM